MKNENSDYQIIQKLYYKDLSNQMDLCLKFEIKLVDIREKYIRGLINISKNEQNETS